ncbi:MAG: hypothetical protein ACRDFX_13715, partial [Chloroflexota bacterium]
MLGQLDSKHGVVIADMEAGIGTLVRMAENSLDLILLLANPSEKAFEVVRRAHQVIAGRKIAPEILVLANRVRGEGDVKLTRQALGSQDITAIP